MRLNGLKGAAVVLSVTAALGGCGLFDTEEILSGERIRIRDQQDALRNPGAVLAATPIPAATRNPEWTQTAGNASHASGHLVAGTGLSSAWRADAGSGGSITSSPIVVGGRIYTLDAASQMTAFDPSGNTLWRQSLAPEGEGSEDGFGGGLASDGQSIIATTGFGEIIALDPASGSIRWRYQAPAPFRAAPAVGEGLAVAVTRDNRSIALGAARGQLLWRLDGVSSGAGSLGGASPAISGGLAVIPFSSGEVAGVQARTGRRIWSAVLGGARRGLARSSISDVTGDPVIAGRAVIAANQSGRMVAIDGQTGQRGWTRSVGAVGPIWAAGDSIYVVSDDSAVVRLAIASGQTVWRTEVPAFEDPEDKEDPIAYSGAVLAGGRVLVTDSLGNLLSFDPANGEQLGTVDLSDGTTSGPVVANGVVYVLSDDGTLQAFR